MEATPAAQPQVHHALQYVALADIDLVENTRSEYEEDEMVGLTQSVRAHGVLQPISLRPHPLAPDRYQLAAGHRRYFASERAGLADIPASIREMTDHQFLEIQLLENLQRQNVSPADEARAFANLLANDFTVEEIAEHVGKPARFVAQRAKLADLIPFWMVALRENRLPLVAAHELARLPAASQEKACSITDPYGYTVKDRTSLKYTADMVRKYISSEIMRDLHQAAFPKVDELLLPAAGACTTCPKRSGAYQLLFEEEGAKDFCLDAVCFGAKKMAFVERRTLELTQDAGKAPVRITAEWNTKTPGVVPRNDYQPATSSTKGAVEVLVVDGPDAGQLKHVVLSSRAKPLDADQIAQQERSKKEVEAARIRANRLKRVTNQLLAQELRAQFVTGLEQNGPGARQLLVHFVARAITYGVSKAPIDTLEYLVQQYGFDRAAGTDLDTQYRSSEPTLHEQYLRRQLARLDASVLVVLYFDLKFRERIENEEYDNQRALAKYLPGGVPDVSAEAEQLLVARFYTPRTKKGNDSAEVLEQALQQQFEPVGEEVPHA
ncbi:ParB/RepB/Spo0J family partition protein [Hymenobacter algoricola]|uniref:ParB/RepB/Spo0J family partition protein n=1 Tax=Hymenobacter algoricola TaxID=486267 RepID=UPI0031F04424